MDATIVCALLAVAVTAAYLFLKRPFEFWKRHGIPYEQPALFVGNLFQYLIMQKNMGTIVTDIYRKHQGKKVVGMYNFNNPVLVLRDPELVHKVFVTDFQYFGNNDIDVDEKTDSVVSKNMFVQKGERWKRTRQQLSPAFTINKVKAGFDKMVAIGESLNKYVKDRPQEHSLKHLMALFTSEIVASCGLGIDGHSFTSDEPQLMRMGKKIFDPTLSRGLVFLLMWVSPSLFNLLRIPMVPKEVPEFFDKMLRTIIRHREKTNEQGNDMMRYWIGLKKKSEEIAKSETQTSDVINKVFTEDDILAGCITFFIEGYETSSLTSSSVLYRLIMNPDVQERATREIDEMLLANGGKITFEGVTNMPYLDNCILETIRLHPALYSNPKRCTKRYEMDIGDGKTFTIEPGMSVTLPVHGIGTDPLYWNNPERFDPDRHTEEEKAKRGKGLFYPFGDGPRICIGMRMTMIFMKVAIISLLKDFTIVSGPNMPETFVQEPRHFMSCPKGGYHAKFVKRT